ncbi:MAG: glycogen(starch) synthase [Parcubacteria bacterium C7867-004]|nr:MAG: glycogen(starch) synthase [Parcubacteria bacterium C7867-004]
MRLLIATPLYPPELGGPATYSKILEEELPKHGITVALVKFTDVKRYPKGIRSLLYFFTLLRAGKDADLIFALDPVSTGLPSLMAAKLLRKPLVLKIVGDYAWEQGKQRFGISSSLDMFVRERQHSPLVRLFQQVQTYVAKEAKTVIVPSEYLKGIIEHWGVANDRITVIHNAVTKENAGTLPKDLPQKRPRIISVGRLVPWKGMGGLIDAVADARQKIPDATLIIAGEGPDRNDLEAYAKARLRDGYQFTGSLDNGEVHALLASADMLVLNSSYEGLSHLLIEAMIEGTPTIATAVGGNGEVITDGVDGMLVPHGDRTALADAIVALATEEGLAERLHFAAKESSKRFSVKTMIEQTSKILTENV